MSVVIRCKAKSKTTGEQCRRSAVPGKEVCRYHGGLTPHGIASPNFRTGRYSKYLPTRLADRYQLALTDPELLNLSNEIALNQARTEELLQRVAGDSADVGPTRWRNLQEIFFQFRDALRHQDMDAIPGLLEAMGAIITKAVSDYAVWDEIKDLNERRRRLVESERDRRVKMQEMLTVEDAMALLTALTSAVRATVTDTGQLAAIQREYDRLTDRTPGA